MLIVRCLFLCFCPILDSVWMAVQPWSDSKCIQRCLARWRNNAPMVDNATMVGPAAEVYGEGDVWDA